MNEVCMTPPDSSMSCLYRSKSLNSCPLLKNILLILSKPFSSYKYRRSRPMQNDSCGRGLSCDYHRFCTRQVLDRNYTLACLGLDIPRGVAVGVPGWPDQQWHLKALNDFETLSQWAHATMKPARAHDAPFLIHKVWQYLPYRV